MFRIISIFVTVVLITAYVVYAHDSQQVVILALDHSFEVPDSLQSGVVRFVLQNNGMVPHHAQLVQLKDGVSVEEVLSALELSPQAVFSMVTFEGGPSTVLPGRSTSVYIGLLPGKYLVMCFMEGEEGIPHLAKGMVATFEVVGRVAPVAGPNVHVIVDMSDFNFVLPEVLWPGTQIWKVNNNGSQAHELSLVRLQPGKTVADVVTFFQQGDGDPPMVPVGGVQALSPGGEAWMEVDLEPGMYVALCFVPDQSSGHPHVSLGMIRQVIVK